MTEIVANKDLVAYCGLYCGACRSYLKDRCPGCHDNLKASWCAIRTCSIDRGYSSCADCGEFPDPMACRKFNNIISKLFGFVFKSDRAACVRQIKKLGLQGHAEAMAKGKKHTIRKGIAE